MNQVMICHLEWDGVNMRHSPQSDVAMIDDSWLPELRGYGAPRGVFSPDVQWTPELFVNSLNKIFQTNVMAPSTVLLNFERMDRWSLAEPALLALQAALQERGVNAVYLYDWHGESDDAAAKLDGRMVPMNRDAAVMDPTDRIVPILHPLEWGLDRTRRRMRDLIARGHTSCVLWACTSAGDRTTPLLLSQLVGYWHGVADRSVSEDVHAKVLLG